MMPRMWPCEWLETTDSTQREALRRLDSSNGTPFALWTTRQTSGLGSHGRRWHDSPDGGLAISIALPQMSDVSPPSAWPLKLSLVVVHAIESCHPGLLGRLGVKWPNDVMAGGAKLAGVLVSRQRCAGRWWLVAGVGINLAWSQRPDMDRPVSDLRALGVDDPEPAMLVDTLCRKVDQLWRDGTLVAWASGWREEFLSRDVFAGRQVRIVHPLDDHELEIGRDCGVTETGELLLDRGGGDMRSLAVGEVSLRQVVPEAAPVMHPVGGGA
jgi:BirA family biotin operon repressor/biotin-[acetyl-CoA-carboxylase] ligase